MPVVDVELVTDELPGGLAARLADAIAGALGALPGHTWVRVRQLPVAGYAEDARTGPMPRPVFVTLLRARLPDETDMAGEARRVAESVAVVTGRPIGLVHVLYEPPALGRIAFGGELLAEAPPPEASDDSAALEAQGPPVTVRPADPGDAAEWIRMRRMLWPDEPEGHDAEVARFFAGDRIEPAEALLAIDAGGAPVGFAELSIRRHAEGCVTDRVAYLEGWYVDPHVRRRGAGRALVEAAERWGREQGCTEFGSDALLENEVSARAHRALGFDEVEQIRCFRKSL